ncbi:MAG: shikimate kinase [Pseudomonadota bacterium]
MRIDPETIDTAREAIGARSVVLIGLMGAGKSSIGRRLAQRLALPFADADTEIERAAGVTISDIFAEHGEAYFRDGEARVISRLLTAGQKVLATGGGAVMNESVRTAIRAHGISVWLKADIDLLVKRVKRRNNRPLLVGKNPHTVLTDLIAVRHPFYERADLTVVSRDVAHDHMVADVLAALAGWTGSGAPEGADTIAPPPAPGAAVTGWTSPQ